MSPSVSSNTLPKIIQWHIGGDLFFGNDGFLYISVGDEGYCCDRLYNTQRLDGGLWSGILRIDVDMDATKSHPIRRQPTHLQENPSVNGPNWPPSSTQNYFIPDDNPFLDVGGSMLEEFYAIGFRHPWTMFYDTASEKIWVADVGQAAREEIIKHFEMDMDESDPFNTPKRLETRFIVHATDGYYTITYKWNDQGTDATLMTDERLTKGFITQGAIFELVPLFPL